MPEPKQFKLPHLFAYSLLVIILGFFFVYGVYNMIRPVPDNFNFNAEGLLLLTVAGAFGGLLHAMRDGELEVPHKKSDKENHINPGLLVDCFAGVAGGYVIFLILPIDLQELENIKIVGTGMLGGYGGRILLDGALKGIIKEKVEQLENQVKESKEKFIKVEDLESQVKESKEKVTTLESQIKENSEKITSGEETNKRGAKILARLDIYFDLEHNFAKEQKEQLKEEIKAAPSAIKNMIFTKAKKVRTVNMFKNKNLMERTLIVFEALIDSDKDNNFHHNYAQISWVYRDRKSPNLQEAKYYLTKAIETRDSKDKENQINFWFYELNLAMFNIHINPNQHEDIWQNLITANSYLKAISDKKNLWDQIELIDKQWNEEDKKRETWQSIIENWAKAQNYLLEELK